MKKFVQVMAILVVCLFSQYGFAEETNAVATTESASTSTSVESVNTSSFCMPGFC